MVLIDLFSTHLLYATEKNADCPGVKRGSISPSTVIAKVLSKGPPAMDRLRK
jgi:hypothetical protein